MSYDTLYFAMFLAGVWLAFAITPWHGWVLLAASIVFYSVAGLRDSLLAACLIAVNYGFQFPILKNRRWLWAALAFNFGVLAYFKYRVFLVTSAGFELAGGNLIIPLGLSFYIFQLSAFLIDLSRGKAEPFYSLPRFALFKLFFGQLVAGPIMRWRQFGPQIHRLFDGPARRHRLIGLGLGLCLLGLVKKIVLADSIAPLVDDVFRDGPANAAAAWYGLWLFAFQIYFDFSGYCDIGLGAAYLFGIRLALNFRQPYLSRSPQEFWQRWHITLSQWIRDYLYIPLGGSEGGAMRNAAVLIIVMGLAGLWHGASWTFAAWGLGWALVILLWRAFGDALAPMKAVSWLLTFVLAMVLWTFFRAADIASAFAYCGALFGLHSAGTAAVPPDGAGGLLALLACLSLLVLHGIEAQLFTRKAVLLLKRYDGIFVRAVFAAISIWLLLLPKTLNTPFIYFRF